MQQHFYSVFDKQLLFDLMIPKQMRPFPGFELVWEAARVKLPIAIAMTQVPSGNDSVAHPDHYNNSLVQSAMAGISFMKFLQATEKGRENCCQFFQCIYLFLLYDQMISRPHRVNQVH